MACVEFRLDVEQIKECVENVLDRVVEDTGLTLKQCVEKQIAKEHHHTRIDNINDQIRVSVCPTCLGLIYTHSAEFPKYCSNCGQCIKWEV